MQCLPGLWPRCQNGRWHLYGHSVGPGTRPGQPGDCACLASASSVAGRLHQIARCPDYPVTKWWPEVVTLRQSWSYYGWVEDADAAYTRRSEHLTAGKEVRA